MEPRIRRLLETDIDQLMLIERQADQIPLETIDKIAVAHVDDEILGYVGFSIGPPFCIGALGVRKDCRRQGIGSQLIRHLINRYLSLNGSRNMFFTVDETHIASQLHLRSMGFRAIRTIPKRFGDRAGYVMRYEYCHTAPRGAKQWSFGVNEVF